MTNEQLKKQVQHDFINAANEFIKQYNQLLPDDIQHIQPDYNRATVLYTYLKRLFPPKKEEDKEK